mmetsp:Transcript_11351/g.41533  ORF Transcript_11351/g.41533 Transcript_11351/m.41533 type:complete len:672 (+) Transcript_11351:52-2067(+)
MSVLQVSGAPRLLGGASSRCNARSFRHWHPQQLPQRQPNSCHARCSYYWSLRADQARRSLSWHQSRRPVTLARKEGRRRLERGHLPAFAASDSKEVALPQEIVEQDASCTALPKQALRLRKPKSVSEVATILRRLGRERRVEFIRSHSRDFLPSIHEANVLLDKLRCRRAGAAAQDVLDWLIDSEDAALTPTIDTFLSALRACANSGHFKGTERILSQMEAWGLVNDAAYSQAVICYLKLGWRNQATKVLERYEGSVLAAKGPDPYNKFLERMLPGPNDSSPERLFKRMLRMGVSPNMDTFQSLAAIYAKQGDCHRAELVLQSCQQHGFTLSPRLYTSLLNAYALNGALDKCEEVLVRAQRTEADDGALYAALLNAYCRIQDVQGAERTMGTLRSRALDGTFCIPALAYSSMIRLLSQTGSLTRARAVFDEMVKESEVNGMQGAYLVYSAMMEAYIGAGDIDDAELVFELMRAKKIPFNEAPCRILLEGYGQHREVERLRKLFNRMCDWGLSSSQSTLITLANAFSDAKDLKGLNAFTEFLENLRPSISTGVIQAIVRSYVECGDLDKAEYMVIKLCKHFRKPVQVKYFNIVLEGICKAEDARRAESLLDVMKGQRLKANSETMLILQEIYTRAGMEDEAQWVRSLRMEGGVVNVDFFKSTVDGWVYIGMS